MTLFGDDVGGSVTVQVPLDELDRYYALPWGVAITPDKSKLFVTTAGSESVTVVDVRKLLSYIRNSARARRPYFVNDLSASANYVTARIPVGKNPRGVLLSPDGKRLYVANRLDDTISVIDTSSEKAISTIDLGGPKAVNALRHGEQIFYTADYAFQGQFGCASCHLDSTIDGLQWDLEPDGFGKDIVDNRSLEDLAGTEPFKWNGGNPDMPTECGPRTEKFFYRSQSYNSQELTDVVKFVYSLPYRPNRYRCPMESLPRRRSAARRFSRGRNTRMASPFPKTTSAPIVTAALSTRTSNRWTLAPESPLIVRRLIDVPQLPNVAYSAPYLHDGSARSLEEIWTVFNPKDTHGVSNDLRKEELNDLVEYLKTL